MGYDRHLAPGEIPSNLFQDALTSNEIFLRSFTSGATLANIEKSDPNFLPPAISSPEGRLHPPQYQRWNLELQQEIGNRTSLSLGYYGHHGIHELVENPNANAFGFGSLPAIKCTSPPVLPCADPRFSGVTEFSSAAVSNYNGMVISTKHLFSGFSQGVFELNYTYGHAFDEVSNGGLFGFAQGSSIFPQDPHYTRGAYGPAEYDVRHSLNANYVWELPLKAMLGGHRFDYLVTGWQISGAIFARTGLPYTVFDYAASVALQQNNYFGQLYSVPVGPLTSGSPCGKGAAYGLDVKPCLPPQFFILPNGTTAPNPNALFVQADCESGFNTGNLPGPSGPCSGPSVSFAQGRNRFRGPGYFNTDFAIIKNTKIHGWENAALGIGLTVLQFFQSPQFWVSRQPQF